MRYGEHTAIRKWKDIAALQKVRDTLQSESSERLTFCSPYLSLIPQLSEYSFRGLWWGVFSNATT